MKKIIIIGGVMILVVISFMFYIIQSLNNSKSENDSELIIYAEETVKEYLIQEKSYSKNEILKITSKKKAKSSDLSVSGYEVDVVFSDEPDAIYIYQIFDEDEVKQIGITGPAIKHKDIQ